MLRYTFEVFFNDLSELQREIKRANNKINNSINLSVLKENVNNSFVFVNAKGAIRTSIDNVKYIHEHKCTCSCCPTITKTKEEILINSNKLINSMKINDKILQKIIK